MVLVVHLTMPCPIVDHSDRGRYLHLGLNEIFQWVFGWQSRKIHRSISVIPRKTSPVLQLLIMLYSLSKAPPRGARHPTFTHVFRTNHAPKCLKFEFMSSLLNHAECQIDFSRIHASISIQLPLLRLEICPITPPRFPLGGGGHQSFCTPIIPRCMAWWKFPFSSMS